MDRITEPPLHTLARLDAAAQLAAWKCPHCKSRLEPIGVSPEGWVRAVDVFHEPGCPDFIPD